MAARLLALLAGLAGLNWQAVINWLALATLVALGIVWDANWPVPA